LYPLKSSLLVCPNCLNRISVIDDELSNQALGYLCDKCELIFPVKEGILIILAKEVRNYELEYQLLLDIKTRLSAKGDVVLNNAIERTIELVKDKKGSSSWQWDDEQFWSKEYANFSQNNVQKNWNDRLWQRQILMSKLSEKVCLNEKVIFDVGCGEGQNFRYLVFPYCTPTSLYIATDISFAALKINRQRNPHKNSIYILCSADHELPVCNNSIDLLCYFGILHHTKNKHKNIEKGKRVLAENGFVMFSESVDRFSLGSLDSENSSAHEELINKEALIEEFSHATLIKIIIREESTPILTLAVKLFPRILLSDRKLFSILLFFDVTIASSIGRKLDFLSGGEILGLLQYRVPHR
jgi:ubiquinone/menaquinone biosynthesis C-methylase UbiE/uncharacterized protein YbaR (Trm112 family)